MKPEEEKALIEQAKSDIKSFGPLYDAHFKPIFGYVFRRTASVVAAQDITSEVFLKAISNLSRYQWRGLPFSAWLYRIASNEVAAYFNRDGHERFVIEELDAAAGAQCSPEQEIEQAEAELARYQEYRDVQKEMRRLPIKYQEVIALRYFEKKPLADIAVILGKSENTVKTLLYRGLAKLRKGLLQK